MNRRTLLIGAAVAVLVAVLWYFLLWSPRSDDIAAARDRKEAAQQQVAQLQTEIARLQAEQRDEPLRRAQLEKLRSAIPDDPNLAQFILDANDAAVRAGIDFISIAPTPPAAASTAATTATTVPAEGGEAATTTAPAQAAATPPAEVRLALQIQGGYFQVLDFMNRLNDLPRLVVTDSVNVSSDQTGRLTVALQGRMFTRALPPGFGGPPTTTTTTTTAPGSGATTTTAPGATTSTTAGATP